MTDVQPLLTDDLLPESSKAEKAETDRLLCIISTPPLYKSNYHLISHEQGKIIISSLRFICQINDPSCKFTCNG